MNKGVLILSGYNIRAVVAFCRWASSLKIPFHLVARNKSDPIFLTKYSKSVSLVREHEQLQLEDLCGWISHTCEHYSYSNVLVLPSTEFLNRFMVNNKNAIELAGGIVPLVVKELYEYISDKYTFGKLCLDFGISIPEEYQVLPAVFPFVAKPRNYASIEKRQLKPYLIYGVNDLSKFRQNENEIDYFFQEYIDGESHYLLAYIPRNGKPILFSQENLIQQPNGGSIILARRDDIHKSGAAGQYFKLLAKLNFHGLIMIEIRLQKEQSEYFMIEANPRLWGPMQFVVDNGIDIFGAFLRDYGFSVPSIQTKNTHNQFYFWSGGLAEIEHPTFHNYSPDRFSSEISVINNHDLFFRKDTIELFTYETSQTH